MAGTQYTNPEFELRGFNHLALVCRDMQETVDFYSEVLGMTLVKTLEFDDGGQHFFLDMGTGVTALPFSGFPMRRKAYWVFHAIKATMMRCNGRDVW